ncbi:hypothetical protein BH23CHL7_BH23CHL7_13670 [soil metagenome]
MCPRRVEADTSPRVSAAVRRTAVAAGSLVRDERLRRDWSLRVLAARAGLSAAMIQRIESGQVASLDSYGRLADVLGLTLQQPIADGRRRRPEHRPASMVDLVHSAMGELEAGHLRSLGRPVAMDEPYQHFQFAGRADLVSWDVAARALLHLENRSRFPDFQDAAGRFNAKRAYLGASLADRLGVRRWASQTHVIVALWSAEVLHSLRLRSESFRALCPDKLDAFDEWWAGSLPTAPGATSALVVLDPLAEGRQRLFIGIEETMTARPRHRGYADAAAALERRAIG